ncbi:MAG: polysaccharide biosynthesis C-terminal domain-containing protein, partial [Bacteroidota bacterium]
YSPHYRYALFSLSACAAITVGLNLWLIPTIGFYGAAVSTLISVTLYNSFSVWLIWRIYRLFPFTRNTLISILLAVGTLFAVMLIPETGMPFADIILKGGTYALLFAFFVLRLNISPDLSALWKLMLQKLLPGRNTPVE